MTVLLIRKYSIDFCKMTPCTAAEVKGLVNTWISTVRSRGESGRESLPVEYLDLLIYVIHTEVAACLSNHVLRFSRFSYQKNDSWVANITLRCWRVSDKGPDPKERLKRAPALANPVAKGVATHRKGSFGGKLKLTNRPLLDDKSTEFKDDEPIYLPMNLREVWKTTQKDTLSFE
jgi:hypothetical protein